MYKILIRKMETKTENVDGEWRIVDTRPFTREELNDTADLNYWKGETKEIMGYTPPTQKTIESDIIIYSQILDDIELSKIIIAINDSSK